MQKANSKIRREQKKLFYQRKTLYPLFRGNGGTWGTKSGFARKICIPVCILFLKMYPLLYLRGVRKNRSASELYPMYPALYSREGVRR